MSENDWKPGSKNLRDALTRIIHISSPDGFVSNASLLLCVASPEDAEKAAAVLIEHGLWRRVDDGYRFNNDFMARNEESLAAMHAAKKRGES